MPDFPRKPHRGKRDYPFKQDPDNFVGVVLSYTYSLGPENTADYTLRHFAWAAARRSFEAQASRLARFFTRPIVQTGEISLEVIEVETRHGQKARRAVFSQPIEITES